ncbi:MAG: hypothetical protein EBQ96_09070 [Proteobacteria bacterium]|nr:hypothetical protein [Pseudomonadota bacterium]
MLQRLETSTAPFMSSPDTALEYVLPSLGSTPIPVIVDSPHSGRHMPDDWRLACDPYFIRQRTEDCFIDAVCSGAPHIGAHFMAAQTARAYLDVNRPVSSLMPTDLKPPVRILKPSGARDVNARNGRGLYWRICMVDGQRIPIVRDADIPDESAVLKRIRFLWSPYHRQLQSALRGLLRQHGIAVHFNLHAFYPTGRKNQPEIVVGDLHGRSCARWLTQLAAMHFVKHGYDTAINAPYPGGEIIRLAGAPCSGLHSLQIEIRKDMYMDSVSLEPNSGFWRLKQVLENLFLAAGRTARTGTHINASSLG